MEHIWVITNSEGGFIKAYAKREDAKKAMEAWRENFVKCGLYEDVSKVDAVYYGQMTFTVTERSGKKRTMYAREQPLL